MTKLSETGPDFSNPKILLGLGIAGIAILGGLRRYASDPEYRAMAHERASQASAEREARHRAFMENHHREQEEKRKINAWFGSEIGRELMRQETQRVYSVREPFPDLQSLNLGSGYPSNRYGWRSSFHDACFQASFDYISNRGGWHLEIEDERIGGEFSDGEVFTLHCPEGQEYLTERQRDVILRLLGGEARPHSVVFIRHHNWNHIRDRLWRDYGPK